MVLQVCCCGRVAAEENGCACGSIPSWLSAAAQRAMEAQVVTSTITVLEGPAGIRPCGLARLPGAFASGSAHARGSRLRSCPGPTAGLPALRLGSLRRPLRRQGKGAPLGAHLRAGSRDCFARPACQPSCP